MCHVCVYMYDYISMFLLLVVFSNNENLMLAACFQEMLLLENNIRHGNQLQTEEKLTQKLSWEVRMRILSRGKFMRSKENEEGFVRKDTWRLLLMLYWSAVGDVVVGEWST